MQDKIKEQELSIPIVPLETDLASVFFSWKRRKGVLSVLIGRKPGFRKAAPLLRRLDVWDALTDFSGILSYRSLGGKEGRPSLKTFDLYIRK